MPIPLHCTSSSLESFRTLSCHDGQFRAWPRAAVPVPGPLADSELQVSLRSASRRSLTRADSESGPYCQLHLRTTTWPGPGPAAGSWLVSRSRDSDLPRRSPSPSPASRPGSHHPQAAGLQVSTAAPSWRSGRDESEQGLTGPFGAALKKAPRRARQESASLLRY